MAVLGSDNITHSTDFKFNINSTERMRINNVGKILAAAGTHWTGTVSQNGTSSIIEQGSNANGEFVKYADGTQICWKQDYRITDSGTVLENAWDFPAIFINAGSIVSHISISNNAFKYSTSSIRDNITRIFANTQLTVSKTNVGVVGTFNSPPDSYVDVSVFAIGRWY